MSRPTVYIAASRTELGRVTAFAAALAAAGFDTPVRWWLEVDSLLRGDEALLRDEALAIAGDAFAGIVTASAVVYLVSPNGVGNGCKWEAGIALGAGTPLIVSGERARETIFVSLADTVVQTDEGALARCVELFADELVTANAVDGAMA